ncbi:T9SS type A sorting domain-containing protein [Flavobacterium sp. NST-5]|uniref:T9SS type A sorting domain-containing protein n=1 Tax=Flavobacterium ichthyis TaxID=2698827 RepID=A0ABW9Z4F3_9FLAO|nr:T9SS type A sorting domain-containing protein [Flavobacterium ichthyis]NBL63586.1 T9SS type A sorting domain-containing protein [Flavobacterium ichthyis]
MKQLYILALSIASTTIFAQQTISFEQSEGYELATIHGQNGWTVTEGVDGLILNQVISNEQASAGTFSFKNAYESAYGDQFAPIIGAERTFIQPVPSQNFTISYDVRVSQQGLSDFEFTLYTVVQDDFGDYFAPIAGVGIENRGYIYLIKNENYGFDYANETWTPNQWINIKIEITTTEVKYYINNALSHTIPVFLQSPVYGFNMLHNNYGANAYYDNIVITSDNLSIKPFENTEVSIYPNPTSGEISVQLPQNEKVSELSIYNMMGQKVAVKNQENFDVSHLTSGTYFLQITTEEGNIITKKFLKK